MRNLILAFLLSLVTIHHSVAAPDDPAPNPQITGKNMDYVGGKLGIQVSGKATLPAPTFKNLSWHIQVDITWISPDEEVTVSTTFTSSEYVWSAAGTYDWSVFCVMPTGLEEGTYRIEATLYLDDTETTSSWTRLVVFWELAVNAILKMQEASSNERQGSHQTPRPGHATAGGEEASPTGLASGERTVWDTLDRLLLQRG